MVKATEEPSGDQANPPTPLLTSVSISASPPSARMSQRLFLPERSETKASHRPSGDHLGFSDDFSPRVNGKLPDPSAAASQICVRYSLLSSVITGSVTQ